jgi:hypothetical protein
MDQGGKSPKLHISLNCSVLSSFEYAFVFLFFFVFDFYVLKNCVYVWELKLFKIIGELLYDDFL